MELPTCIPLPINQANLLPELVEKAKDWAVLHGVGMRSKEHFNRDSITFVPFLLFPSTFHQTEFEKAVKIQKSLNELMHKVAHDDEFLRRTLAKTVKADAFTARLFKIYEIIQNEPIAQKMSLGLFRSDYILDQPTKTIKQVEFNTIASSFGALTSILPNWHKLVLRILGHEDKVENIPISKTTAGFASGILEAFYVYKVPSAAVLFVTEDKSFNIGDQRFLEFEIQERNPKVRVLRRTLTEVGNTVHLDEDKRLIVDGIEVAVVYFRSGYMPGFYHSELEWTARLVMERSRAIKCPSIQYQLAGTKKVQQELARPGVLESYLKDPDQVKAVREVFTGLYSLDLNDPIADEAIKNAIQNPSRYVLKPQREGGGNNLYDDDIPRSLEKIRYSDERNAWILMDKIVPFSQKNYILRPTHEQPFLTDVVSELGIFGVVLGDADKILVNEQAGHMLRTKTSSANEAGVASGLGALDSLYLLPAEH